MLRWTLSFTLLAASIFGQSFQGGIRGLVTDAGGGAVAGAKVSLIDQGTNAVRASLTNETGEYVFNGVVPAVYTVSAESPSFKKFERKGVSVGTQQFVTIDMKLEVGQVTESVMVTEEVPVIETANASAGQLIDRQKLIDLPNLGRNPFMMAKVAQNVVAVGNPRFNRMQDQSGSSQISLAGGPVRGNNYLLDGMNGVFKKHDITRQQYNVLRILRGQHPGHASINLIKDRMIANALPDALMPFTGSGRVAGS